MDLNLPHAPLIILSLPSKMYGLYHMVTLDGLFLKVLVLMHLSDSFWIGMYVLELFTPIILTTSAA